MDKVQYIAFFEEYFDYAEDLTGEQYKTLMLMIRDLRFKGIDILPKDIEDMAIRLAWRSLRPTIKKSAQNAKAYSKKQNTTIQPNEEFDMETGEVKPAVSCYSQPVITEEVKQPQNAPKEAELEALTDGMEEDMIKVFEEPVNGLKSAEEVMSLDQALSYLKDEPEDKPQVKEEPKAVEVKQKKDAQEVAEQINNKYDEELTKAEDEFNYSDTVNAIIKQELRDDTLMFRNDVQKLIGRIRRERYAA